MPLKARGQARYRTPDLPLFRRMLYQLSYLTDAYCCCNICTRRRVRTPNLSICVSSALPVELGGLVGKEGPSDLQSRLHASRDAFSLCSLMGRVTTTLGAVFGMLGSFHWPSTVSADHAAAAEGCPGSTINHKPISWEACLSPRQLLHLLDRG